MFLSLERAILERHAPGLDQELAAIGLEKLETPDPHLLPGLIKKYQLPGLLVAEELGGAGCSPYDLLRLQRAIAARAPSMGVMLTMHHFTISFCNMLTGVMPAIAGLLGGAARDNMLVASGFAEGRFGAGILDSTMMLSATEGGYRINGSKKPCTMAHCMDILTAGVAQVGADGERRTGMAVLFANQPGMQAKAFWNNPVLAAADCHELQLTDVFVPHDHVLIAEDDDDEKRMAVATGELIGLCWFEIIASATYLGVASGLAERALANVNLDSHEIALLASELDTALCALDGAVRMMEVGPFDESLLPRVLAVRFAVQRTIERSAMHAAELVGGLGFIRDSEVSTLLAASRCLAFHPISRKAAEPILAGYFAGRVPGAQ